MSIPSTSPGLRELTDAEIVRLTLTAEPLKESDLSIESYTLLIHGEQIVYKPSPSNRLIRLSFQKYVETHVSSIEGQMFTALQALTFSLLEEIDTEHCHIDETQLGNLRRAHRLTLSWKR